MPRGSQLTCFSRRQHMYRATYTPEEGWRGGLEPYGPLQLEPSAQVTVCQRTLACNLWSSCGGAECVMEGCAAHAQALNYGQSVFEGMKAQRSARGRIVLFRPDENAARMMAGVRAPLLLDPLRMPRLGAAVWRSACAMGG